MLKRIIKGQLYFTGIFLCLFFLPAVGVQAAIYPIIPAGTFIEAEHYTGYQLLGDGLNDGFSVELDSAASGGRVLVAGSSGSRGVRPQNEVKKYRVYFHEAGIYYIWIRGTGFNNAEDSMFFTVTNAASQEAWNLVNKIPYPTPPGRHGILLTMVYTPGLHQCRYR